ncbi:MAG: hypothetical protein KAW12_13465 [Candidatus Aminicenantes bacterium]|nr:hypothetical protein [Candidatus Aminicenantes bacterium]
MSNNNTINNETGWFPIAKIGKWKDMAGKVVQITKNLLQSIADNYSPGSENFRWAPALLGHPKHDAPKYAKVSKLKQTGNLLYAKLCEVHPELVELIKEKKYSWVSPVIRLGENTLKELGILGVTPAIPLPEITPAFEHMFAENDEGDQAIVFRFAELDEGAEKFSLIGTFFKKFREHLIETKSIEAADRIVPDYMVEDLLRPISVPSVNSVANSFAEMQEVDENPERPEAPAPENIQTTNFEKQKINQIPTKEEKSMLGKKKDNVINAPPGAAIPAAAVLTPEPGAAPGQEANFAEVHSRLSQTEQERDAALTKLAGIDKEKKDSKIAAFCDGLMKKGKLPAAKRPFVAALLNQIDDSDTVSFVEHGGTAGGTILENVVHFADLIIETNIPLDPLPRVAGGVPRNDDDGLAAFAEKRGLSVDDEDTRIYDTAQALAQKEKISFTEAMLRVNKGGNL